jgi:hypothetical protein
LGGAEKGSEEGGEPGLAKFVEWQAEVNRAKSRERQQTPDRCLGDETHEREDEDNTGEY